ncbi:MAG TPA: CHRD domain-containing protein, partial [Bryobacterales bacterium]|nr:CHRD domain-containing protein [Bryobacterales bacterium]
MGKIARVVVLVVTGSVLGFAHTTDTIAVQALMTTGSETTAPSGEPGSGDAILLVHVIRDDSGTITSGVMDFDVNINIASATNIVAIQVASGAAGQAGAAVINTDLSAANPFVHSGGTANIRKQVAVSDGTLLTKMLAQPDQFYLNVSTQNNPAGLLRGQLAKTISVTLRTALSPLNEAPPITNLDAGGGASITVLGALDSSGNIAWGHVNFDINYNFAVAHDLTAMHIHHGSSSCACPVVIPTNLKAGDITGATGGNITKSVLVTGGAGLDALKGLFVSPGDYYFNLHTTDHPGGAIRGTLQYTGRVLLRTDLSPNNEVPPATGSDTSATGVATVAAYVTRNGAGQVTSGTVNFSSLFQFSGATTIVGMHIHNAPAGTAGSIVIPSGVSGTSPVSIATGVGGIFRSVNIDPGNKDGVAALNAMLAAPDQFYLNLHTPLNPGGAMRGQLGVALTGPPAINQGGIISAVNDTTLAPASPGALITIYGANLSATSTDASGLEAPRLPITLDGTEVGIDGRQAPVEYVSPTQINVQVPFETETGNVEVFV